MPAIRHPHKYKRHRYKTGYEVYFCTLPACSHRIEPELTLGKESICNRCGSKFIMNEYSIRLAEPHCTSCHKPKEVSNSVIEAMNFTVDTSALANKVISNETKADSVVSLRDRLLASITGNVPPQFGEADWSAPTDEDEDL